VLKTNLAKQYRLVVGECHNYFCCRGIGLMVVLYHEGEEAAFICVGDCIGWEDTDDVEVSKEQGTPGTDHL
jgi:hypothetical protein